jgi:hypothetical protein
VFVVSFIKVISIETSGSKTIYKIKRLMLNFMSNIKEKTKAKNIYAGMVTKMEIFFQVAAASVEMNI